MDVLSTLVGLGILFLIILFVITLKYGHNMDKKHLSTLQRIADENNIHLDKTECSSSLLLGLDKRNGKLIVVEPKNNEQSLIIDLQEISACELKTTNSPEKASRINFISLNLMDRKGSKRALEIVFYDDFDFETRNRSAQLQMAKRWRSYLQSTIIEVQSL